MKRKYIIRRRRNRILYIEFLLASVATGIFFVNQFKLHPTIGVLIGIAAIILFYVLFFALRIFRYLFSILFSLGWALGAFMAGGLLDKRSDITGWVFAIIAFGVSTWAHWDHFSFIKEADFYEYQRSNMTLIK